MANEIKYIHIGGMLLGAVNERKISEQRICSFIPCEVSDLSDMYASASINTELLLRWSKLLEYDFFRIYSQHLILYSPQVNVITKNSAYATLPNFRKNIYTHEVIEFLLGLINSGEKTVAQVVEEYGVPKTTIYRWRVKHKSLETK